MKSTWRTFPCVPPGGGGSTIPEALRSHRSTNDKSAPIKEPDLLVERGRLEPGANDDGPPGGLQTSREVGRGPFEIGSFAKKHDERRRLPRALQEARRRRIRKKQEPIVDLLDGIDEDRTD